MSIAEEPWPEELPEDEFEVDPGFGSEEDYPEDRYLEEEPLEGELLQGDALEAGPGIGERSGVVGWS